MEESLKVFIVDDEKSVVEWLVKNVEWEVYNCEVAGYSQDAAAALQYMETHQVDLLFTDISMPEMSGLELIKKTKEWYPDLFIIVISAYDKFTYVKEAFQYGIIDYCLKPIDLNELHDCLKIAETAYSERRMNNRNQDITVFRNSIFQRLINGDSNSFRLDEQCTLAGIDLDVSVYQIVIVDTRRLEKNSYISILNRFNQKEGEGFYCFLDGMMNLVFLFMGETGYDKAAEKRIKEVLRREGILYHVFFCVGEPLKNYEKIAESYRICFDFLSVEFLFPEQEIRTERYPYKKYLDAVKNKDLQLLANSLRVENQGHIMEMIQKIVDGCSGEEEKKKELICMVVFLIKNVRAAHAYGEIRIPQSPWRPGSSIQERMEWMEGFYKRIVNTKKEYSDYLHPHVKYALRKVDTCYGDSTFSIQEIASACHVSPVYLGRVFKEQTGEYFNAYLLNTRLKVAEMLLQESKLRMGEIAEQVGFSSQSYFNKMFRRNYGISPAEYRTRCNKER